MRTTIELPDELLMRAKSFSALKGMSLKEFFIQAVEHEMNPPVKKVRRDPPVIHAGGPVPSLTSGEIDAILDDPKTWG